MSFRYFVILLLFVQFLIAFYTLTLLVSVHPPIPNSILFSPHSFLCTLHLLCDPVTSPTTPSSSSSPFSPHPPPYYFRYLPTTNPSKARPKRRCPHLLFLCCCLRHHRRIAEYVVTNGTRFLTIWFISIYYNFLL